MRKPVVPSTTKNNWVSIKDRLDSALEAKQVKSSTKVSKKVTSVTQNAETVAEKFRANQLKALNSDPLFEAKRKEGFKKYWEERRKKKERYAKVEEYHARNGIRPWTMLMPDDLYKAFKKHCKDNNLLMSTTVCELILEFITKPTPPAQ